MLPALGRISRFKAEADGEGGGDGGDRCGGGRLRREGRQELCCPTIAALGSRPPGVARRAPVRRRRHVTRHVTRCFSCEWLEVRLQELAFSQFLDMHARQTVSNNLRLWTQAHIHTFGPRARRTPRHTQAASTERKRNFGLDFIHTLKASSENP